MSVLIETTIGDMVFDLCLEERPRSCLNFLKLCKVKYYNFCSFHSIRRNFIAQSGDPSGTGRGGESIFASLHGAQARYFELETKPRIRHQSRGTISFVNNGNNMHGSQFFITLGDSLDFLDGKHTVFGRLTEGFDVLEKLNETICDDSHRPYQDVRISHTIILDDPFDDPVGLVIPDRSPEPTKEQLDSGRIAAGEDLKEEKSKEEAQKDLEEKELKIGTKILETIGDIDDAEEKPPENVLFVCKLNPVTNEEDLKIIFSRFGKIISCEIIKDRKTDDSLCYGFVEFKEVESCEKAYFKMDNVLIDDRRIHVDFCQSLAKIRKFHKQALSKHVKKDEEPNMYKLKTQGKTEKYSMVFDEDEPKKYRKKEIEKKTPRSDKIRKKREYSSDSSDSDVETKKRVKKSHEKKLNERRKSTSSSSGSNRSPSPDVRRNKKKDIKTDTKKYVEKKERSFSREKVTPKTKSRSDRYRSPSYDSDYATTKRRHKPLSNEKTKKVREKRLKDTDSEEERICKKMKRNANIKERKSDEEIKHKERKKYSKEYSSDEEYGRHKKSSQKDQSVKKKETKTKQRRSSSEESDFDDVEKERKYHKEHDDKRGGKKETRKNERYRKYSDYSDNDNKKQQSSRSKDDYKKKISSAKKNNSEERRTSTKQKKKYDHSRDNESSDHERKDKRSDKINSAKKIKRKTYDSSSSTEDYKKPKSSKRRYESSSESPSPRDRKHDRSSRKYATSSDDEKYHRKKKNKKSSSPSSKRKSRKYSTSGSESN